MEICFEKKYADIFTERLHQLKSCAETVEAVVPDTNDDIGRIAALNSVITLKSKEISPSGAAITGEIRAWQMYIAEGGSVQSVQLSREFKLEYDSSDALLDERLTHVKLYVNAAETRVINPRKIAVTFEICGELWSYGKAELCTSSVVADTAQRIYAKYEQSDVTPTVGITEKSFVIAEQFAFNESKALPAEIIGQNVDYEVSDIQIVGSRAVIKGNVFIKVSYTAEGLDYPLTSEFASPFSQLIDVPDTALSECAAIIQPTGVYLNIIDTINDSKTLDVELHCLTELLCFGAENISYLADAYCNTAEVELKKESRRLQHSSGVKKIQINTEDLIEMPEDCSDILAVYSHLCRCSLTESNISAQCLADMIYRTGSGQTAVVKRTFSLQSDRPEDALSILHMRVKEFKLYPAGSSGSVSISAEAVCLCECSSNIEDITAVELSETMDETFAAAPSVTLVRMEEKSLWQLAKEFRSNEGCIKAANGGDEFERGELLLIPKTK